MPTSSKPGLCRKYASGYYVTQYINRFRDRAMVLIGRQIRVKNFTSSIKTYEKFIPNPIFFTPKVKFSDPSFM